LGYLAKFPITDENGERAEMNLYRRALDTLIEKNTGPDGEKPAWLDKIEMVFHWGMKAANVVDKIG
jgi:hypothetical protein